MEIVTIETASLGDRSYLVVSGSAVAVVDPQRDLDRILDLVASRGLRVTDVFETHVHNDYVTGGHELARVTGAAYHVSAEDDVEFDRSPIRDGDEVVVGDVTIRAVHTPGHTPTHMAYVLVEGGREVAVFSGGSMLYGSVGRTDLVASVPAERLTRLQHRSVRRLAELLPDDAAVHPTHGFGSFCSSGDTSGSDSSTIAQERRVNDALRIGDEDEFVGTLLAGLDAYPAYYAHMAPRNRSGPGPADLSPVEEVDAAELRRRVHAGEWVVDLRTRTAFAHSHLAGTINVELDDSTSTYLGWLMPWGTPVTLLADTPEEVAAAQRQLVRIGVDRPAGQRSTGLDGVGDRDRGSYRIVDFPMLLEAVDRGEDPWVLDTRLAGEWRASHLTGAHHVPLHELASRLDEVPVDRAVWIHCASGFRASIAASLLARAGRTPVLVDDDFDDRAAAMFHVETASA